MKIDASLRVQRVETQTERQQRDRESCTDAVATRARESGYDLDLLPVRERARARSRKDGRLSWDSQEETRARESVSPKISSYLECRRGGRSHSVLSQSWLRVCEGILLAMLMNACDCNVPLSERCNLRH